MNPPAFQPLQRRGLLTLMASAPLWASGCAALADGRAAEATPDNLRGTGDLGVVIQRARGAVTVVNTSEISGSSASTNAEAISVDIRRSFARRGPSTMRESEVRVNA